jgi:hypothetical protein
VLSLSFNYTTHVRNREASGTSGSLLSGGAKVSRAGGEDLSARQAWPRRSRPGCWLCPLAVNLTCRTLRPLAQDTGSPPCSTPFEAGGVLYSLLRRGHKQQAHYEVAQLLFRHLRTEMRMCSGPLPRSAA